MRAISAVLDEDEELDASSDEALPVGWDEMVGRFCLFRVGLRDGRSELKRWQ